MQIEVTSKASLLDAISKLDYSEDNIVTVRGESFETRYRIPKAQERLTYAMKRGQRVEVVVTPSQDAASRRERMLKSIKRLRVRDFQ